jgi:peptide/nickel transport system substrate-binding protein
MAYEIDRRTMLRVGAGFAAGLVAVELAGCSSSGGSSRSSSSNPATAVGGGKRGGTLMYATAAGNAGDSPDPAVAVRTLQLAIAANCYDTLTFADQDYNLSPALATEWTASNGTQTWSFRLRDGVTFHDGSALTAQDVAYTFKRVLAPTLAATALGNISPYLAASGIDASDPTTITFNLLKPNAFFPVIVSAVSLSIVKNGTTDFSTGNGTGPFSITSFDPAARLTLARYDHYWKNGLPYLDGVEYVVIDDDATRIQALTTGSQNVADNITGAEVQLLTGNNVTPYVVKAGGWVGLTMFGNTAPFNNPMVIQAMQYAANRATIMSVVAPGIDLLAPDIPIPPSDPFYPAGLTPKPYDPDKAKALLKAAGHSDLGIDIWAYEGDKLDTVVSYKSTAASAGITINIQDVPHATFFSDDFLKKPAIGISVARLHIAQALPELYSANGALNMTHFQSDQVDNLVQAAVATTDVATQKRNFTDALTIIGNSAANVIPGWEGQVYGLSGSVHGMLATNGGQVYQTATWLS